MDDVLIEIGVEELPHNDVKEALAQTPALAEKLLDDAGLPHGDVTVHVSPRRIAVIVKDVPARQQDVLREMRGPKRAAAKT
ncbi:MAG TPA: glycine--tRNA ligase subunit beta, partial [Candidatus Hydrogenedentes bacterium]|nr:glycine--tRNA ligase subunit beta [Candidatus Hydrogenedentota bacterium]